MTGKELEQIYNEAYKAVYWTAMAFMKNEADAEDIVQDTFVALIESYDSIKDKSKVTSWLKKTAANKCLDRIKLSKTDTMEDEFFEGVEAVPEDFLPDSIVESEDARKIVMNIINNSLSDDIRRTLILFYFDEMSIKEIAVLLGVPEGTVSRRLNFARNKIKKEVEKYEKDKDTKLYGMAIPFLTKLFMKEAEQVIFKPLPASLANLSASAEASKAGTKIAKSALKKGTDIMKTKILIGSGAAVVAVGATVGIILGVMNNKPEEKPVISDTTSISEVNEVNEVNNESVTEATSEVNADTSARGDRWVDSNRCIVNGHEIVFGQSTVQELVDSCYTVVHDTSADPIGNSQSQDYTLDTVISSTDRYAMRGVSILAYPDEASSASEVHTVHFSFRPPVDGEKPIRDCIVDGFVLQAEDFEIWGDNLQLDFPFTMTLNDLVENSGEGGQIGLSQTGIPNAYAYVQDPLAGTTWSFYFDENDEMLRWISFTTPFF
jgi:RNA polymerase sigma factor (sigma-70 family)